ncbi:hypothetical protein AB3U99_24105 [Niallia sp. JL1B1071]|uniref:hypothetical protein n=1 Tax=Niallia tiangongensis TaxID=3237105 RepID=UPI0037DCC293
MKCNNCLVEDLSIEIMYNGLIGHQNVSVVSEHLQRRKIEFKKQDNIIVTNETGAREILDFCLEHMKTDNAFFRLNNHN